ncbi:MULTISPECIES: response regulator transcription factor [Paenibacillus]|uniref:Helix-turn-helix domain-containing protein n=1 Tax=Paenibacillus residui TaxID=629724 RepID=A0ABW3DBG2_9BACL|nr:helix-turn-helix domain-containing protein [Paenibacillus sp. 32O-W]
MWKALLVEDEPYVRRHVIQLVDWAGSGFELVGEAGNGEEALEMMKVHRPDLVITDILMPNMDGLELLQRARETGFESMFIMLTCMSEFEYARRALELGASGYVLKLSMGPDSLNEMIGKAHRELLKRYKEKTEAAYYRRYASVWESFAGRSPEPGYLRAKGMIMEPQERFSEVWIGCALSGPVPVEEQTWLRRAASRFPAGSLTHHFQASGYTTLFCWSPVSIQHEPILDYSPSIPVAFATGKASESWISLWSSVVKKLDEAWYECPAEEEAGPSGISGDGDKMEENSLWTRELELLQSAEQGRKQTGLLLRELMEEMRQSAWPALMVKECALRWVRFMKPLIPEAAQAAKQSIREATKHAMLLQKLEPLFAAYVQRRLIRDLPVTDHPEVNILLRHIHSRYNENLTLKSAATLVCMDETYLSGLFRKKTGTPFIQYVQKVRVERAKHYLSHTDLPVLEIGHRVGFMNTNYFFRIFKKLTGMTPMDFRREASEPSLGRESGSVEM